MALLDTIRRVLGGGTGAGAPQAAPAPSAAANQAGIQSALQAKSGKAGAGPAAPAASTVQADTAAGAAQANLAQQQLAGQQQAAQLGAAEQAQTADAALAKAGTAAAGAQAAKDVAAETTEGAANRQAGRESFDTQQGAQSRITTAKVKSSAQRTLDELASTRKTTMEDIFSSFAEGKGELAFRADAAEIEQVALMHAMADQDYVRQLEQTGILRRLDNQGAFEQEVTRLTNGEATRALLGEQDWERLANADQREFDEIVSKIDPDLALQIAGAQAQNQIAGAGIKGVSEATTAITQASDRREKQQAKQSTETAAPQAEG